jgi:hypothetical protein
MNIDSPIIFSDGIAFYEALSKTYIRHKKGLFILAPSGAGKTYFVDRQTEKHWIDGDYLWPATNADLTSEEWQYDPDLVKEINMRCDIITNQAKKLGFWVIGSSNDSLRPDAIVLPEWETHLRYIQHREENSYDGGATSNDINRLLAHREIIARWTKDGVPTFTSINKAAKHFAVA